MEEKNKISVIVIIILSVLLVGVVGYLVYDKVVLKNSNQVVENNTSQTSEGTKINISKVELDNMTKLIELTSSLTDEVDLSKMDNQSKLRLAFSLADDNLKKGSDLKKALVDNFGNDLGVVIENMFCYEGEETPNYLYDKSTDSFKLNENHDGHDLESVWTYVGIEKIESDLNKNLVTLSVKKLYTCLPGGVGPSNIHFFTSRNDTWKFKNEIKNFDRNKICNYDNGTEVYICEPSKVYDEVKNDLQLFNYTFENQNGKFVLKSISK